MKIKNVNIEGAERGSHYHMLEVEDFEYVNPIVQISSLYLNSCVWFDRNILTSQGFIAPKGWIDELLFKNAVKEWAQEYRKIISTKIPHCLFQLLEAKTKKDQIKSLKGLSLE